MMTDALTISIDSVPMQVMQPRFVNVCAWCDRVKAGDGTWHPASNLKRLKAARCISHGICPTCMLQLKYLPDSTPSEKRGAA